MARRSPDIVVTELVHTPAIYGIETASSTYLKGAPLVWASGKLAEASTNPRDIAGFALFAASGTTNNPTEAIRAMSSGLVRVRLSLDKASGLGTVPLAQTHVGAVYGITRDSGGKWYLDIDKTTAGTNTVLLIEKLIDPIGATQGDTPTDLNTGAALVECSILSEATATGTAAA